ncbi:MAG: hypothetical protein HFI95_16380 [Lachnospiraceae bacterium]|nr:hypothetical protein [Lachnospiraceae bacterium]
MKITNKSNKIIGMNGLSILPGETAQCPAEYENNPVIQKYISNGVFEKVDEKGESGEENGETEKALSDMTKEELTAYASEHGIDIGNATTEAGILKKIQEAQKEG